MIRIAQYDARLDVEAAFQVWQAALGGAWPLTPALFQQVIDASGGHHFVARDDDEVVGFVATQLEQEGTGSDFSGYILAIAVAPWAQGRGIGTALHDTALDYLHHVGARSVQLGGGRISRFWPGVPNNLHNALPFFTAKGWHPDSISHDMVRHLGDFQAPDGVYDTLRDRQIDIAVASQADVERILEFEAREFPFWFEAFAEVAGLGDCRDLLVGRDREGRVLASLIMYSPHSHPSRTDAIWKTLLGDDLGALGSVGVAAAEQGKGFGLALVARGSELLRERGVSNCHIGWTHLLDFYGKLGYTRWESYTMSRRELDRIAANYPG
jgi:ribosomal protein S18 acetylase RimI-like enzyme